jgi:hypothetical protein
MAAIRGRALRQRQLRRGIRSLVTTLVAFGLFAVAGPAWSTGQVGEPAADFTLQDSEGFFHTLSDYQDNVVLLFMVGYG